MLGIRIARDGVASQTDQMVLFSFLWTSVFSVAFGGDFCPAHPSSIISYELLNRLNVFVGTLKNCFMGGCKLPSQGSLKPLNGSPGC